MVVGIVRQASDASFGGRCRGVGSRMRRCGSQPAKSERPQKPAPNTWSRKTVKHRLLLSAQKPVGAHAGPRSGKRHSGGLGAAWTQPSRHRKRRLPEETLYSLFRFYKCCEWPHKRGRPLLRSESPISTPQHLQVLSFFGFTVPKDVSLFTAKTRWKMDFGPVTLLYPFDLGKFAQKNLSFLQFLF